MPFPKNIVEHIEKQGVRGLVELGGRLLKRRQYLPEDGNPFQTDSS